MGTTFSNFLKAIDAQAHKQYVLERYAEGHNKHCPVEKPDFSELKSNAFSKLKKSVNLDRISDLPDEHFAKKYIVNRKIPTESWGKIFFTSNFKQFILEEFSDEVGDDVDAPEDERIVLLYKNPQGEVTNIAGRALNNSKLRYITIKVKDDYKVFGVDELLPDQTAYVVEGQFDSFFLDNCVASGDSNLCSVGSYLNLALGATDVVLVFDNEPRNKEICRQIDKAISLNYKVTIFPDSIEGKDINDMITNGATKSDIKKLVEENIFSGLSARMRFTSWKKC
jgi:hypothetical protein